MATHDFVKHGMPTSRGKQWPQVVYSRASRWASQTWWPPGRRKEGRIGLTMSTISIWKCRIDVAYHAISNIVRVLTTRVQTRSYEVAKKECSSQASSLILAFPCINYEGNKVYGTKTVFPYAKAGDMGAHLKPYSVMLAKGA